MAIEFHCNHCGHSVKTSADNAGKRGKCPHCHQSVYIPTPAEDIEPLHFAPVDENEEQRQKRLRQETIDLQRRIETDRTEPPAAARPPAAEVDDDAPLLPRHTSEPEVQERRTPGEVERLVVEYVLAMADGDLDEAEGYAQTLRPDAAVAQEVIQRMGMDELPPAALAKLPRPVVNGVLKQLANAL